MTWSGVRIALPNFTKKREREKENSANGYSPEEKHEGVGHAAGHLHSADIQHDKDQQAQAGNYQVAHWQFNAKGGEDGPEIEGERKRLTAGYA